MSNSCRGLFIIDAILLSKALCHEPSLAFNKAIRSSLDFINPLKPNYKLSRRQVKQFPCMFFGQWNKFLYRSFLLKRVSGNFKIGVRLI